ncbi:MAG: APC family permease, partial [Kangiellaceae bacterium]|nr:APC family permease [Kangiellaceae bacterium]
ATYLSSELDSPQTNLPKILFIGTGLVLLSYVLLNFIFLYTTPIEQMVGKVEVGYIVALSVFGETAAAFVGVTMSLLLVSTVSAMTLAGPRVLQVIGEDFAIFKWLAKVNQSNIPSRAIYFQSGLAIIFVVTSTFESILVFSGFALALNNFFAVLGIFILRYRQPDLPRPYKTWLYPLPPVLFLLLIGWTLFYLLMQRPIEAGLSLIVIALGVVFYFVSNHFSHRQGPV